MKLRGRSTSSTDWDVPVRAEFVDGDPSRIVVFDRDGRPIGELQLQAALFSHEVVEATSQEREYLASQVDDFERSR